MRSNSMMRITNKNDGKLPVMFILLLMWFVTAFFFEEIRDFAAAEIAIKIVS